MSASLKAEIIAALGSIDALILEELLRTQASPREFHDAMEWLLSASVADSRACLAWTTRMQRLVDLLSVVLGSDREGRLPIDAAGPARRRRAA